MKIEILKVENGKIIEPENLGMEICMTGCGGGGGGALYSDLCYNVCAAWGYLGCASDANMK
ncbi:hypothetical protein OCC_12861 [Thermococcus litoralis DSM 5473]|jgi:hypothetical protein|uniref:Uncharacterized protein n=1 Tax=Thermococcus litoralis (strain ATCC 51850 / DSM 5473 / JCM 8560 / NS-C) TaxID=523849 RepID=H3ZP59_THELN|nr:hypothetical protein [Thermococcus litoralis]EHR78296.1 hypothetical protein OCC_12861 [Thermococcus litoralis DSM 5473]KUJ98785.1 MAG: Uncharacterized protein XD43_1547 [Thermococcales archaeon 44_46]HIH72496.1 hypothetical protein [Thermococcaceae archaeon]